MQLIQKRYQNVHLKKKKFFKPIFLNIIFMYFRFFWSGEVPSLNSAVKRKRRRGISFRCSLFYLIIYIYIFFTVVALKCRVYCQDSSGQTNSACSASSGHCGSVQPNTGGCGHEVNPPSISASPVCAGSGGCYRDAPATTR